MKNPLLTIGSIRRAQIVDAAVTVIAEQGLQHLSLSAIEKKVGMSRGHLMYYFKAKEDILLAVFDRLLELMCRQHEKLTLDGAPLQQKTWFEVVGLFLKMVLEKPPVNPEFHALQYTFLSQIGHREDFRRRLAELYEQWRGGMAIFLGHNLALKPPVRPVDFRTLATVVQALFHGLAVQAAADPEAMNRDQIVHLCLDLLSTYLWNQSCSPLAPREEEPLAGGAAPQVRPPLSSRGARELLSQPGKKSPRNTNKNKNGTARRAARVLANGVHHGRKQRQS